MSELAPAFVPSPGYITPVKFVRELLPLPDALTKIVIEYGLPCFGGRRIYELNQVAMARGARNGIVYDKGAELHYWCPLGDIVVFTSSDTHPDFRVQPRSWTVISVDGKDWVLRPIHGLGLFAADLETGYRCLIGQDCEELYHTDGDEYITCGGRYTNRLARWSLRAALAGLTNPLEVYDTLPMCEPKMPSTYARSAALRDGEICTRSGDGLVSVNDAAGGCRLSTSTMACISGLWDRYGPICFGDNYLAVADGEMIRIYR